ncbi:MAG: hypothetical protein KDK71_09700 [Chlamydiia bacterium]|nr:hypothetical protein [Chlamydiia bacterium]
MTEALSLQQCDAIAENIMEHPAEKMGIENAHTLSKIVEIQLSFFKEGQEPLMCGTRQDFNQLSPVNHKTEDEEESLEGMVASLKTYISESIQEKGVIDRIETLVTILVDGNEVFRETKTFDQQRCAIQAT